MITPDGRLLEGAIQALHLAVGLGMGGLSQAMFYALFAVNAVKTVPSGQQLMRLGRDLHSIVGQDGVHPVRQFVQPHRKNSAATTRLARGWSSAKVTLLVRTMATKRYGRPSLVCTSAKSTCR